jgi:hypothetical protein
VNGVIGDGGNESDAVVDASELARDMKLIAKLGHVSESSSSSFDGLTFFSAMHKRKDEGIDARRFV